MTRGGGERDTKNSRCYSKISTLGNVDLYFTEGVC